VPGLAPPLEPELVVGDPPPEDVPPLLSEPLLEGAPLDPLPEDALPELLPEAVPPEPAPELVDPCVGPPSVVPEPQAVIETTPPATIPIVTNLRSLIGRRLPLPEAPKSA
jgi:hypothetical protein